MTESFTCPRRSEVPAKQETNADAWRLRRDKRTCSYCGSLHPDDFFKSVEDGQEIGPTDKNYKVYVGGNEKFYFQHLSEEQMQRFIDLWNAKKIRIGYPYFFYVCPFFAKVEKRDA